MDSQTFNISTKKDIAYFNRPADEWCSKKIATQGTTITYRLDRGQLFKEVELPPPAQKLLDEFEETHKDLGTDFSPSDMDGIDMEYRTIVGIMGLSKNLRTLALYSECLERFSKIWTLYLMTVMINDIPEMSVWPTAFPVSQDTSVTSFLQMKYITKTATIFQKKSAGM
ncbi:4107_t:CDS:2 [Paraglomus occultum]|uniref:4107_t:CDS:1 n=1 Tax=Paraglomus occultum TaxID=144539 RepID=A0A9N9GQJ3_9GLOM|nr:4107_t:CDS:2 [Paraglomus occultum]